jgi:hypothetical protein
MKSVMFVAIVFLLLEVVALQTEVGNLKNQIAVVEVPVPVQTTAEACASWLFNADLLKARKRLCGR